jgi:hypothetical protein
MANPSLPLVGGLQKTAVSRSPWRLSVEDEALLTLAPVSSAPVTKMEVRVATALRAPRPGGRNSARNTFVSKGVGNVKFWDVYVDSGARAWMAR